MFLECENSGQLSMISGKFQNNAINEIKQISLSHAIIAIKRDVQKIFLKRLSKCDEASV